MPLQEFLTLFIFYTFAFKKKCLRSLHAKAPVRSSFTSEPSHQSVNGMKMNVICLMQSGEYPVVTKSYNHGFLKSNSVTNFSQNNAVENYRKYQKKQGSTIIMAWSLIIIEWP